MAKSKPKAKHGGARPGSGPKKRKRWIEDYAQLGAPPADPLERTEWLGQVLAVALQKVLTDPGISEEARLIRIRQLTKDLRALVPDQRRWQAEQRIVEWDRRMNAPPQATAGSEDVEHEPETSDQPPLRADPRR